MRFFIIPDTPALWIVLAIILVLVIGATVFERLRPPAWKKLREDARYLQALAVYAENLPHGEWTRDGRELALTLATRHLTDQYGIPPEKARPNMRVVAARYDRDQSYELRYEASIYERASANAQALEYYELAAERQKEHDPPDYQSLWGCSARGRRKVRSRKVRTRRAPPEE